MKDADKAEEFELPNELSYGVAAILTVEPKPEEGRSKITEIQVSLFDHPDLRVRDDNGNETRVRDEKTGQVNKYGMKMQTQALLQGILANIHTAHQQGMWDSAEHLRYVVEYLEKGFVQQVEVIDDSHRTKLKKK